MLSNNDLAAIFTPIVVAIALAAWIGAVYYANAHPRHRPKREIKTEVAGGAFMAVSGGRQLMPIPSDRWHDIPGQRGATSSETYHVSDDLQTARDAAAADEAAEADTSPLAGRPPR